MPQIVQVALQVGIWGIAIWVGYIYLRRYFKGNAKQVCLLVREDNKLDKIKLPKVDTHVDDEPGFRIWHLCHKLLIPAKMKMFGGMILILTERNSIPADIFHALDLEGVKSLNNLSHVADVAAIKEFAAVNKKGNMDKIATAVMWGIGLMFSMVCIFALVWLIRGGGK